MGSCLVMNDSALTGIGGGRGARHAMQIRQLCKSVKHTNTVESVHNFKAKNVLLYSIFFSIYPK